MPDRPYPTSLPTNHKRWIVMAQFRDGQEDPEGWIHEVFGPFVSDIAADTWVKSVEDLFIPRDTIWTIMRMDEPFNPAKV